MRLTLLLILFFYADGITAQSIFSQFFKLSCAEKTWTLTHLFKAKKAFRITTEARQQTHLIRQKNQLDTFPHGGTIDAFRHTFWMASLTQHIGARAARRLGKAHERGNYRAFRKGKTEDGVLQDATAVELDLYNNEQGIAIGKENLNVSKDSLQNLVILAIKTGQLKTLKRSAMGALTNCEGEIVPLQNRSKKDWKLPYCLIPSR